MYYVVDTKKSFEQASTDLEIEVKHLGFGVLHIHDLGKLNSECRKIQTELAVIQDICERLTPFGTVTRYPGSSMKVSSVHLPELTL